MRTDTCHGPSASTPELFPPETTLTPLAEAVGDYLRKHYAGIQMDWAELITHLAGPDPADRTGVATAVGELIHAGRIRLTVSAA